jgi:hypothetical protein
MHRQANNSQEDSQWLSKNKNEVRIKGEADMKKYNLKSIMGTAWKLYRKGVESFATALRMAWANAKAAIKAKAEAGVAEEAHSWAGWQKLGFEVIHESKALYKVVELDPTTKNGTRVKSFFGASQVQPIVA